jgi:hypothetical protein
MNARKWTAEAGVRSLGYARWEGDTWVIRVWGKPPVAQQERVHWTVYNRSRKAVADKMALVCPVAQRPRFKAGASVTYIRSYSRKPMDKGSLYASSKGPIDALCPIRVRVGGQNIHGTLAGFSWKVSSDNALPGDSPSEIDLDCLQVKRRHDEDDYFEIRVRQQ